MKNKTVFVDIDTQFDFMNPRGNLYVPDAEDIIDNIKKLFDYAKEHKIKILSSTDAHWLMTLNSIFFLPIVLKVPPAIKRLKQALAMTISRLKTESRKLQSP